MPSEVAAYFHLVWVGDDSLENKHEIFDRLKLYLQNNGYLFPLVGYSWDFGTEISNSGWNIAKQIATETGERLGIFLWITNNNAPKEK